MIEKKNRRKLGTEIDFEVSPYFTNQKKTFIIKKKTFDSKGINLDFSKNMLNSF